MVQAVLSGAVVDDARGCGGGGIRLDAVDGRRQGA